VKFAITALLVLATACSVVAALLWIRQSRVVIRDNIDRFIEDLQTASRWNSRAAIANALTAALLGAATILQILS